MKRRSWLFVPADSERKLAKSLGSGADALILDLEDSVAPQQLPRARAMAAEFIRGAGAADRPRLWVRINALTSPEVAEDLAVIVGAQPAGLVLPKAGSAADCKQLAARLETLEQRAGLAAGAILLMPIVTETPAAVLALDSYRVPVPRLAALCWGAEDLAAALGASRNRLADGSYDAPYQLARTQCLLAARAASLLPIDAVYTDFRDAEGVRAECALTRAMGFAGKLAIHPDQIGIINECFAPSAAELEQARRIVAAFAASGAAVLQLDGRMIDRPHLRQAEQLLAAAGAAPGTGGR